MCLGISGRIVSSTPGHDLGQVEVAGVVREINLALLDGPIVAGEFILIHSGFALERISPERAADALAFFGPEADDAVPSQVDG
jgi:hydrogenase expression/formation protein HypC